MACRGERTTVIHSRAHRHSRRHLVVEESANPLRQRSCDQRIVRVVAPLRIRIDRARQVALQLLDRPGKFANVRADHDQHGIAKCFGLKHMRSR